MSYQEKACGTKGRNSFREIYPVGFFAVQIKFNTWKRKGTFGHTRGMCRQDYHSVSCIFVCSTSGSDKTYLTISDKFFVPNLMHYLRSYLKACHICQLARNEKPPSRQLQTRINLNYRPMSRLSMDLKVMPRSQKRHCYILCVIDEMTNYSVTAPLYQARSEEKGEALIENIISKYGIPEYTIMDQASAFMSTLMSYLFKRLGIKIKTVDPYNHQSLQAEHRIKSLSAILMKHLMDQGQN